MGQVRKLETGRAPRARPDPEAAAALKLAAAIDRATARLGPAADTIVGFGHRLDLLCAWLKKWGPWALGTAPIVLTVIGGSSAQVGQVIAALIKAYAAHPA